MPERDSPRFKRKAIREDLIQFAVPALVVFTAGLIVSGWDGYRGLTPVLWDLVTEPGTIATLSAWNIAGLAMFLAGLTEAIVAVATLRRSYAPTVVIRKDHELVTRGVYRLVRHPVYLGVLVAIMGVPVYASSWRGFAVMAVLIPIVLNRIRLEERLLTEEFGEAYRAYRSRTRKLIPFIF